MWYITSRTRTRASTFSHHNSRHLSLVDILLLLPAAASVLRVLLTWDLGTYQRRSFPTLGGTCIVQIDLLLIEIRPNHQIHSHFQPLRLLPLLVSSRYIYLMIGACHVAHLPSNVISWHASDVDGMALLVCFSIDIKFQYSSSLSQCSVALFIPHHSYRTDTLSPFLTKI